jgi:septal ring factor EnvC (AmiA/AmiB activator)
MAEVVGTLSAIIPLVTLAFQSSITLYQTVQSLQSRDKVIRELRQELEALQDVLRALGESIRDFEVDLTVLEQPLKRCNKACGEFNALIMKCTSHSTQEQNSKRDWIRLRYMGGDITNFKDMLSSYKSTISIALAYANL